MPTFDSSASSSVLSSRSSFLTARNVIYILSEQHQSVSKAFIALTGDKRSSSDQQHWTILGVIYAV